MELEPKKNTMKLANCIMIAKNGIAYNARDRSEFMSALQYDIMHICVVSGQLILGSGVHYNFDNLENFSIVQPASVKLEGDCSHMFENAALFRGNLCSWDTSRVTSMANMFKNAKLFNSDISSWDVSSVTDMSQMFYGAESFNIDISPWKIRPHTDLNLAFCGANSFKYDLLKNLDWVRNRQVKKYATKLTKNYERVNYTWDRDKLAKDFEIPETLKKIVHMRADLLNRNNESPYDLSQIAQSEIIIKQLFNDKIIKIGDFMKYIEMSRSTRENILTQEEPEYYVNDVSQLPSSSVLITMMNDKIVTSDQINEYIQKTLPCEE